MAVQRHTGRRASVTPLHISGSSRPPVITANCGVAPESRQGGAFPMLFIWQRTRLENVLKVAPSGTTGPNAPAVDFPHRDVAIETGPQNAFKA